MYKLRTLIVCLAALAALASTAGAQTVVTVRFGEQETCTVRNATTGKGSDGKLRFDLSSLPKETRIVKAELRYWIDYLQRRGLGRTYGFGRYSDPKFDGFSVWNVGDDAQPLDTRFPFNSTSYGLFVYDVTKAAQRWVADPNANKGLRANAPLPSPSRQPAWQRPYLQVTYVGPNPKRPKQPTELKATCRDGQVFITWKQLPHTGAFFDSTYRIYQHTQPITAKNLAAATLLGEVNRLAQLNYRRTMVTQAKHYGPGGMYRKAGVKIPERFNFVIDDTWAEREGDALKTAELKRLKTDPDLRRGGAIIHQGPALAGDTGLFVWTVTRDGTSHYSVTSVVEGNENRDDFAHNAVSVAQKTAKPMPVLQAFFNTRKNHHGHYHQHREYVLWGDDRFHNTPSTPLCFLVTIGSTRGDPKVFNPAAGLDKAKLDGWASVVVQLHGYSSHYFHNVARTGVNFDTNHIPPTPQAPFPQNRAVNISWPGYDQLYYGSKQKPEPMKRPPSFWPGFVPPYGYVETHNTTGDARKATVKPYLERLVRYQTEFFRDHFPVNPNRIITGGESGSLQLAIHCGDLFAWADVSQNAPWSAKVADRWQPFVGLRRWELKNPEGFNVWDWNTPDWYSRQFPKKEWPWLTHLQATNYAGGEYWKTWDIDALYTSFARNRRGIDAWWTNCGDCPNGVGQPTPMNEPYPVFADCNLSDDLAKAPGRIQRGSLFGYLDWSKGAGAFERPRRRGPKLPKPKLSTAIVDMPERFEMAIRISERRTHTNSSRNVSPTRAKYGITAVTARRLQRFKVEPGTVCVWENRRAMTGQLLQSGTVTADEHGLLTVQRLFVDKHPFGNKLIICPGKGRTPPQVDTAQQVDGMTYAEYVKQCHAPEKYLTVKEPSTTFITSAIGLGNHYKGGDEWGGNMAEVFHFPKAGRYRLTVRAKGAFGLGWPMMWVQIGRERRGLHVIDHTDYHDYHWWDIPVPEGLHEVKLQCGKGYYYQRGTAGPKVRTRKTAIQSITLTLLPEKGDRPAEVRVMPRRVEVPAGFPVQFTARVIDQRGQDSEAAVKWSASGGKIDQNGVFTAPAGEYVITAQAGDAKDDAAVVVGARFSEDFNTCTTRGWEVRNLAQKPGNWECPLGGNTPPLQSLLSQNRADTKSAFVWRHGERWTDYSAQADVVWPAGRSRVRQGLVGVVVRSTGSDHYRFEMSRPASRARFVRRVNGADVVLAETKTLPAQAKLDPGTNPIFPAFHAPDAQKGKSYEHYKTWGLDRIRVVAKGESFAVTVNGRPVFKEPVLDPALKNGTVGLFAATSAWFDNVEVTPAP